MRLKTLLFGTPSLSKRCGYVFPMVLFVTLAVGLFIITVTQFQSSNRQKYQHLNDYQSAFNIAYSALVEVLADIQAKQWSNRSFKAGPKDKAGDLFGGTYNLRVEDKNTLEFIFNVKARVTYKNKNHLFYWRLKYNPNLLDFTSLFVPVFYEDYQDPSILSGDPDELDKKVDEIIKQRKDNQPRVDEIADAVKPADTIDEALKVLGIPDGKVIDADQLRPDVPAIILPVADLDLKDLTELAAEVDPESSFFIKALHFGGDVSELSADQKFLLDTLAELLKKRPDSKIELRGHTTDLAGTPEENLEFSIVRAQNVADYLKAAGISENRMTVKGFGQTQPIASNDTVEGQAKNRRVEFVLKETP